MSCTFNSNLHHTSILDEVNFKFSDKAGLKGSLTHEDGFRAAQQVFIPYYCMVAVESGDKRLNERFIHVYDTASFIIQYRNETIKKQPHLDPISRKPVLGIHYYAIKCFQFDSKKICKAVDAPLKDSIVDYKLVDNSDIDTLLLDGINYHILQSNNKENCLKIRRTHYIIADLIKKGKIFSHLSQREKIKEVITWLWCSSKGSVKGLLDLFNECSQNAQLFDGDQKEIKNLVAQAMTKYEADSSLNQKERQAYIELYQISRK